MKNKQPKTLQEAIIYFADEDNAIEYLRSRRRPDGKAICPTCGSDDVRYIATRNLWECKTKHPKRQFSIKVGTIFEGSLIFLFDLDPPVKFPGRDRQQFPNCFVEPDELGPSS